MHAACIRAVPWLLTGLAKSPFRALRASALPRRAKAAKPIEPAGDMNAPKISFVSLGCPKALVDSERIVTRLRSEGYELTRKHEGADLVIVNTCGFLDSAQAESLEAIGEALNENGR